MSGTEISRGSYGRVYMQIENKKKIAIKVCSPHGGKGVMSPLETHILLRMRNEHVNSAFSVELDTTSLKLYNDLAFNDLKKTIPLEGVPDISNLKRITSDIGKGLSFLHSNRIIHGDIKPENILVYCDSSLFNWSLATVKITDFSLSCLSVTDDGVEGQAYSPKYRSPEVWENNRWEFSSDLWALGVTIYELAYGSELFKANIDIEIIAAISEWCRHVLLPDRKYPSSLMNFVNYDTRWTLPKNKELNILLLGLLEANHYSRYDLKDFFTSSFINDDYSIETKKYSWEKKIIPASVWNGLNQYKVPESVKRLALDYRRRTKKFPIEVCLFLACKVQRFPFERIFDKERVLPLLNDECALIINLGFNLC